MANLMDKVQFNQIESRVTPQNDIRDIVQRARQNPREFENYIRQTNPQGYQRAIQIRNSFANPQEVVLQMAQQRGINPDIIKMLNI